MSRLYKEDEVFVLYLEQHIYWDTVLLNNWLLLEYLKLKD